MTIRPSRRFLTAGLAALVLAAPAVPASASAPDEFCTADPSGDTVDNETRKPTTEPRADLLQQCTSWGRNLSVSAKVASPTNPTTNPAWNGATFVGWFVDTDGDSAGDFFIDYGLNASRELQAVVIDIRKEPQTVACVASASYTGTYNASGISAACLGNPTNVATAAGILFDDGTIAHRDALNTDQGFEGSQARGPQARRGDRISGADRFGTAVAISQRQFPDAGVEVAYLARANVFADAVAGGALTDGPILLVPSCGPIPASVTAELGRLDPARVVALGGASAVCDQVLTDAAKAAGVTASATSRLSGANRFATSVAISQAAFPTEADSVYLARADVFVDAVAGGVLVDGPVLLVPTNGPVPASVQAEIDRLNPSEVVALGGRSAVSDQVLTAAATGRQAVRISGADRFATAIAIAQRAFPQGAPAIHLARADLVVDAIAGGVLTDGPILLVTSCGAIDARVLDEIRRLDPNRISALGGRGAVCQDVLDAAVAA